MRGLLKEFRNWFLFCFIGLIILPIAFIYWFVNDKGFLSSWALITIFGVSFFEVKI